MITKYFLYRKLEGSQKKYVNINILVFIRNS